MTNLENFQRDLSRSFGRWITWEINVIDTAPILIHKQNQAGGKPNKATLTEMAEAMGLVDSAIRTKLINHQNRLKTYENIQNVLIWVFAFIPYLILITLALMYVISPGMGMISSLNKYLETTYNLNVMLSQALHIILFVALLYLAYLFVGIPTALLLKAIAFLTDKPFAESINAWTLVCLLIELTDDDVLQNPRSRSEIIKRIHDLALGISLLPYQYPLKDSRVKDWSRQHFAEMKQYVLDRECWAVAPVETTLEDLRRDFRWFFDIYINNLFGHIQWQEKKQPEPSDQSPAVEKEKSVAFLRRLIGYLIPIGILYFIIISPNVVAFLNLKPDVIGLITLGWVLLGIDTLLGLGVTATITDFVKGIKELSSP